MDANAGARWAVEKETLHAPCHAASYICVHDTTCIYLCHIMHTSYVHTLHIFIYYICVVIRTVHAYIYYIYYVRASVYVHAPKHTTIRKASATADWGPGLAVRVRESPEEPHHAVRRPTPPALGAGRAKKQGMVVEGLVQWQCGRLLRAAWQRVAKPPGW